MTSCHPTVAVPCQGCLHGAAAGAPECGAWYGANQFPQGCIPQQVPAQPGAAPRGRKLSREMETHLLKQGNRDQHEHSPKSHIYTPEDALWSSETPRGGSAGGSPTRDAVSLPPSGGDTRVAGPYLHLCRTNPGHWSPQVLQGWPRSGSPEAVSCKKSGGHPGIGGEIGGTGTRGDEGHPEKRRSGAAGTQTCSGTEPQVGAGEGRRETDPPPSPALTERPESRLREPRPNMAPPSRVRARVRGSGRPEPPPPLRRAPAPSSPPPGRQAPPREARPPPAPRRPLPSLRFRVNSPPPPRRRSASQHEGGKRRPRRDGIVLLRRGEG